MKLLSYNEEFSLRDFGFLANQPNKGVWTFYKHIDFFEGKTFKVIGKNKNQNIVVVPSMSMTIGSALDQTVTKVACTMEFPNSGTWELEIYIDNNHVGNLNVNVE